jgi:hypothetical protein
MNVVPLSTYPEFTTRYAAPRLTRSVLPDDADGVIYKPAPSPSFHHVNRKAGDVMLLTIAASPRYPCTKNLEAEPC